MSLASANSTEARARSQQRRPSASAALRSISKSFTRPSFRENLHGSSTNNAAVSASFDRLDSPQHLKCLQLIAAVRNFYEDQEAPQISLCKLGSTSSMALQGVEPADTSQALPDVLREQLEEEYEDLVPYKGRYLTARALHFAIWLASTSIPGEENVNYCEDVKILLWAKAEPSSCGMYMRKKEAVRLPALHIAAGLGVIEAMAALLDELPAERVQDEIDRYCMCGDRPFYCALHDAVFNGKAQAAVWLLEQNADPSVKNMEGFTALHWLALRGMDEDDDVEVVVRSLVRARAAVDEGTEDGSVLGRIPLELAVKPGSLFPKHLLYLLAPSYQVLDQRLHTTHMPRCSFFEDLALMSGHSGKAAQDFADRVARMPGPTAKHKAIVDAQDENAADCMASLLQMAPEAAASMLGLLLAKPIQESPGHHSLSSRAILGGRTMQCAYKPDMRETRLGARQDRVRWPEWKYDVNTGQIPPWHSKFLRVPREKQARSASVFDVETLALLLPNILDIDIFMALASARSVHRQIFNSLAIKAAVHCLWIELISPVFGLTLLFNTLDLLVLALWGLTPSNRPLLSRVTGAGVGAEEEGRYSSLQHPRFANFLLAGLLRDVANIGWWLFGLCRKWMRHQSQHSLREYSAEARVQELRSGLHALWHPMKIFDLSHNTNTPEMILCLLKTFFLLSVQCSSDCGREMTDYPQALLAVCFFMHCVKLIYMLRVSSFGGKKILVLIKTLVSGAMREIFLIFCLFFLAFALTAVMLDRSVAVGIVSWSLYRGLIFGDGAGLDNMGFAIEGLSRGEIPRVTDVDVLKTLLTVMAILGTVTFIVILNMIIAIYSTEYGRLEMESDLLFQWERAKYCCNCLLGMQKLRSRNRLWLHLTRVVVIGCLAGSVAFFAAFPTGPDAMAAPPPFPLGALLLATAQVGMQALMMRSDWFAVSGGKEGPMEEHFLWIVRRCEQSDLRAERPVENEMEAQTRLTRELLTEIRGRMERDKPSKAASHYAVSRRPTTPRSNPMSPKRTSPRSPRPLAESGKTSL